ncbi:MAG: hypothetical protein HZB51_26895 [Chloroflexi bacterium]|nr:hypothetical protein [Chloroflexota bacterium]
MKPLVIGHRGASAYAPENTITAFNLAYAMGADGIELDVVPTKDGIPVICHYSTNALPTHGIRSLQHLTLAEVKQINAGAWFGEKFRGEKIPTLEQVLDAVGSRGKTIIEVKRGPNEFKDDGRERAIIEIVRQSPYAQDVILTSFHPISLYHIRQAEPNLPRGFIYHTKIFPWLLHGFWFRFLTQPQELHINEEMATPNYIAWARRRNYRIMVYHPDEPNEMTRVLALGVDGIMSNKPDLLRKIVDQ